MLITVKVRADVGADRVFKIPSLCCVRSPTQAERLLRLTTNCCGNSLCCPTKRPCEARVWRKVSAGSIPLVSSVLSVFFYGCSKEVIKCLWVKTTLNVTTLSSLVWCSQIEAPFWETLKNNLWEGKTGGSGGVSGITTTSKVSGGTRKLEEGLAPNTGHFKYSRYLGDRAQLCLGTAHKEPTEIHNLHGGEQREKRNITKNSHSRGCH